MSVSATKRLTSMRRLSFPHIAGAVLAALALFSVLVAISVSNNSSVTTRTTAASPPPSERVIPGYFRDPITHALLRVPASTSSESTPGPGHK
jgi:hypothetical protein